MSSILRRIRENADLAPFIVTRCFEHGVGVELHESIDPNDVVIIKVDDYYNSVVKGALDPSPDCIIVQKCRRTNVIRVTIVELKDYKYSSSVKLKDVLAKFNTAMNDFMNVRFRDLFKPVDEYALYLVTSSNHYRKRDIGVKYEALLNFPIRRNGRKYLIRPEYSLLKLKSC